jgi:hypothetical protein
MSAKLIKLLFLDEPWKEFESIKDRKPKPSSLHDKISKLRFLDLERENIRLGERLKVYLNR